MMKKLGKLTVFVVMLGLGFSWLLITNETKGLALTAFAHAEVDTVVGYNGTTLYASLNDTVQPSGLYRSDDLGYTWQYLDVKPAETINTLVVQPNNPLQLFAGTNGGAVETSRSLWRSDDGGVKWQPFRLKLPALPDHTVPAVTTIAINPSEPESLYVGTAGQGIYRINVGKNNKQGYELIGNHAMRETHIKQIVFSPDKVLYALTEAGLFSNVGGYWSAINSPDTPISLAVGRDNNLYVGTASTGLIRSTDGGATWQAINEGLGLVPGASLRVTALTVDIADIEHVVVATAYGIGKRLAPIGVYESHNGGETWQLLDETDGLVNNLIIKQGVVIAATDSGLVRYEQVETEPPSNNLIPLVGVIALLVGGLMIARLTKRPVKSQL